MKNKGEFLPDGHDGDEEVTRTCRTNLLKAQYVQFTRFSTKYLIHITWMNQNLHQSLQYPNYYYHNGNNQRVNMV